MNNFNEKKIRDIASGSDNVPQKFNLIDSKKISYSIVMKYTTGTLLSFFIPVIVVILLAGVVVALAAAEGENITKLLFYTIILFICTIWMAFILVVITLNEHGIIVTKIISKKSFLTPWRDVSYIFYEDTKYSKCFRFHKYKKWMGWIGITHKHTNYIEGLYYIVTKIPQAKFSECAQKKLAELGIFFPVQFTPASNPNNVPSFTIPEGTKTIVSGTFEDCSRLSSVKIPNSVTEIGNNAFRNCTGLWSIAIPAGVTFIGEGAFSGCTGLRSIAIPRGVKIINQNTFRDCTALKSITIHKPAPPKVTADAFNGIDKNKISLYVPVNSIDAYIRAKGWKNFKDIAPTPREII